MSQNKKKQAQPSKKCSSKQHSGFPQPVGRLCGLFKHQRTVIFEGCVADPLQIISAILPGSKRSWLLLRIVLRDALSEVLKVGPNLQGFRFDDIKAQEVLSAASKVGTSERR